MVPAMTDTALAPAFATFTGDGGKRAWLVTDEGAAPVGYIQDGDGRPQRFDDATAWAKAVADAGMTEQVDGNPDAPPADPAPAPTADPAPAAPEAPASPPAEAPSPDAAPAEPAVPDAPAEPAAASEPAAATDTEPDSPDAPPPGEESIFDGEPDFADLAQPTEETDVSTAAPEPTEPSTPPEPSAAPANPEPTAPPEPSAAPAGESGASPEGKAAKPPEITTGSFVSWGSNRGRVDMVVTNGKVPGIDDDVEGTANGPAARVVIYEADGSGYKPTSRKVGVKCSNLKRTAPLRANGAKSADAGLVDLMAEHEEKGLEAQPGARAVKAVFDRGVSAWPGESATTLDQEEWGLARVKTFLTMAGEGKSAVGYVHDVDLLPETNPARLTMEGKSAESTTDPETGVEAKTVRLDADDLKSALSVLDAVEE